MMFEATFKAQHATANSFPVSEIPVRVDEKVVLSITRKQRCHTMVFSFVLDWKMGEGILILFLMILTPVVPLPKFTKNWAEKLDRRSFHPEKR